MNGGGAPTLACLDAAIDFLDSSLAEREKALDTQVEIEWAYRAEVATVEAEMANVSELRAENDDLRRSLTIAVDERKRAEARVAELEGLLDVRGVAQRRLSRTSLPKTRPMGTVER